ncbi:MAG: hypothetical protein MUC35_04660 [Candidatus Margulisbacteria bacterium]|jgi:hypothetical protein|nr:hypothetical protein [Candidatus Margulisiibacteriota bacterium]
MADYNGYVSGLKKSIAGPDYDRLYRVIQTKAVPRPVWPTALSLAGALAVCLIGFALNYDFEPGANSETVASYLNEGTAINGNELMSYVFQE